jgi:hypothetical protein
MLGPAKADTPRELLGNVGISDEEAKEDLMDDGRRVESQMMAT